MEYSIHMHGDVRGHANEAKGTFKRNQMGLYKQCALTAKCTTAYLHDTSSNRILDYAWRGTSIVRKPNIDFWLLSPFQ